MWERPHFIAEMPLLPEMRGPRGGSASRFPVMTVPAAAILTVVLVPGGRDGSKERPRALKKLTDFLVQNDVWYITISHSPAYTSQEIAETVLVKLDGAPAMAVLPASLDIDFGRIHLFRHDHAAQNPFDFPYEVRILRYSDGPTEETDPPY